jgi:hypothetical protein
MHVSTVTSQFFHRTSRLTCSQGHSVCIHPFVLETRLYIRIKWQAKLFCVFNIHVLRQ